MAFVGSNELATYHIDVCGAQSQIDIQESTFVDGVKNARIICGPTVRAIRDVVPGVDVPIAHVPSSVLIECRGRHLHSRVAYTVDQQTQI